MTERTSQFGAYRFGIFELDLQARELRRRGVAVKLQEKPFQILEALVERPGQVVSRKELSQKLWPSTFVGFDRSLNTAVNSLRRALGDLPANPRFLETRARLGYRFVAPVEAIPGPAAAQFHGDDRLDSIAVLPFRNLRNDSETEYLSDGMSDTLINQLSRLPDVRVMSRSTVFRYKGSDADPKSIGRALNVRALLTGTVSLRGDLLMIAAELVDAVGGWRLWGEQYRVKFTDIFAVQDKISAEIINKLRVRLTVEARRSVAKHYTADSEAYRDYLRGQYEENKMTQESLKKAISHFENAIRRDEQFALPYASLSSAYALLAYFGISSSRETMPEAERMARKALEIDEGLAEVRLSLAGILKSFHWDWAGAELEYKKALELNPNYGRAHQWYADYLASVSRTTESIQEMRRALDLDPLSLVVNMELAWVFYMAHEYDRAVEQALRTLEIEPNFYPAHHVLGLAHEQLGRPEHALRHCQTALKGSPENPISLAAVSHALGSMGRMKEAKKLLNGLLDQARHEYIPPFAVAIVYAGLGDLSQSLAWLERAYNERDVWLVWVRRDPRLDCLSQRPEFHSVLDRMQIPPR